MVLNGLKPSLIKAQSPFSAIQDEHSRGSKMRPCPEVSGRAHENSCICCVYHKEASINMGKGGEAKTLSCGRRTVAIKKCSKKDGDKYVSEAQQPMGWNARRIGHHSLGSEPMIRGAVVAVFERSFVI